MILWFLLLKRAISTPAARDYSPCIVEDGGTVEIAASTGTYIGLRQGCENNGEMKYWNEFRQGIPYFEYYIRHMIYLNKIINFR